MSNDRRGLRAHNPVTVKRVLLRRLKKANDVARLLPEPLRTEIRIQLSAMRVALTVYRPIIRGLPTAPAGGETFAGTELR